MRPTITILALLCLIPPLSAQRCWGQARPAPVGAKTLGASPKFSEFPTAPPASMTPRNDGKLNGWFGLASPYAWHHQGKLIGRYWVTLQQWQSWDGKAWGDECIPPWEWPTDDAVEQAPGAFKFGVDTDKLPPISEPVYQLVEDGTARRVSRETVERRLQLGAAEGQIPDDSNALRITVIGPEPDCQLVTADWERHPALQPFKKTAAYQDYRPDHWAVKDVGFATSGRPTIYFQAPSGKVLHRQDQYEGPEALAGLLALVGAKREPDPRYQAAGDPDLRKRDLLTQAWELAKENKALTVLIVLGVVLLVLHKRGALSIASAPVPTVRAPAVVPRGFTGSARVHTSAPDPQPLTPADHVCRGLKSIRETKARQEADEAKLRAAFAEYLEKPNETS